MAFDKAYTADQLIEIALAEEGYLEKASNKDLDNKTANAGNNNWTKYARDLHNAGYYNGNKNGYSWCDVFVDWCHYKASGNDAYYAQYVTCQTGSLGAGCKYSRQYYMEADRLYMSPLPGDQIFFRNSSEHEVSHTGIVLGVKGNTIYTIEGNTVPKDPEENNGNGVYRKKYSLTASNIVGYGRPRYLGGSSISGDYTTEQNPGSSSNSSSEPGSDSGNNSSTGNSAIAAMVQSATEHNFFNIVLKEVTPVKVTIQIKVNSEAKDKKWRYGLIDLSTGVEISAKSISTETDFNKIVLLNLTPNTPYALKITATSSSLESNQQILFSTPQDRPRAVRNLSAVFSNEDLDKKTCRISFESPESWGDFGGYSDKGYRVSLVIDSKVVCFSDELIKYSPYSVNKTITLSDFLKIDKTLKLQYGNTMQIGIQTWVLDKDDKIILDSSFPTCSAPTYLKHFLCVVDKIYIETANTFKRAVLWPNN